MREAIKVSLIVIATLMIVLVIALSARNASAAKSNYGYYSNDAQSNNLAGSNTPTNTQDTQGTATPNIVDGVQIVNLKVSGAMYVMTPSVLKKGVPVRMIADINSMPGCSKSVVIRDFGVSKYIRQGDNIIEFTPDKTGTFIIACSMNMYRGTFSVTDDGSAPTGAAAQDAQQVASQAASQPSGGSCGAGGGGCGCGGGW